MRIRRAMESEATALSALAVDAKRYWPYSPRDIERWRPLLTVAAAEITENPTFIAELDGAVVGFYMLIPRAKACVLEHLWISPGFARRGIGRALLEHARAMARSAGASAILIDADPNAEPFYVACGAVREGVVAAPIEGDAVRIRPQLALASRDPADRADEIIR